jgi:hypothetical protein
MDAAAIVALSNVIKSLEPEWEELRKHNNVDVIAVADPDNRRGVQVKVLFFEKTR